MRYTAATDIKQKYTTMPASILWTICLLRRAHPAPARRCGPHRQTHAAASRLMSTIQTFIAAFRAGLRSVQLAGLRLLLGFQNERFKLGGSLQREHWGIGLGLVLFEAQLNGLAFEGARIGLNHYILLEQTIYCFLRFKHLSGDGRLRVQLELLLDRSEEHTSELQ